MRSFKCMVISIECEMPPYVAGGDFLQTSEIAGALIAKCKNAAMILRRTKFIRSAATHTLAERSLWGIIREFL